MDDAGNSTPPQRARSYQWGDPALRAAARASMTGLEFIEAQRQGGVPAAPMAETIGWRIAHVEPGSATLSLQPGEYMMNSRSVHGGAIAALLDGAMTAAVTTLLPVQGRCSTVELKVSFLGAVAADAQGLRAEARVLQAGRRIVFAEARLTDATGTLYAHATSTFATSERGTRR